MKLFKTNVHLIIFCSQALMQQLLSQYRLTQAARARTVCTLYNLTYPKSQGGRFLGFLVHCVNMYLMKLFMFFLVVSQVTKNEIGSSNATGSDSTESLAEDLLKKFTDSQSDIKKEPANGKYIN